MNTIREIGMAVTRRHLFVIAAVSLFAIAGLLAVLPAHAQTTTSTSSSSGTQTSSGAHQGYSAGHGCPNMSGTTSTSSSSSSGTG
ncbi:MAG TPA: hypothetical protein VLY21_05565 [Nitrososphaerales archaeon]|nr:hypothetical protein [Nitrososphaerales archaeon]